MLLSKLYPSRKQNTKIQQRTIIKFADITDAVVGFRSKSSAGTWPNPAWYTEGIAQRTALDTTDAPYYKEKIDITQN